MNKKINFFIGKTYYLNPQNFGEYNDGFKKGRPAYILRGVDNERLFLVKSTRTKKLTSKDIKSYIEYKGDDGNRSWLRLDKRNGFEIIHKSKLESDIENLDESILLDEKQIEKLKSYYAGNYWFE